MSSKFTIGALFGRDYVRSADLCYQRGQLQRAAELYLKANRYEQAARLFAELEEVDRAAKIYHEAGMGLKAGELFLSKGRPREAIVYFEGAGAYRQAAEAALQAQQVLRAGQLFEKAAIYERAADCYQQAGDPERVLHALDLETTRLKREIAQRPDHALEQRIRKLDARRADRLAKVGRVRQAAKLFLELGAPRRAAPLLEKAGLYAEAAEAYLDANDPDAALELLERATGLDSAVKARIYRRSEHYMEAGAAYLEAGQPEEAAEVFEAAEAWARAASLWEESEQFERAASLYIKVERHLDAGRCFAQAGQHERAALCFARSGNDEDAANAYLTAGRPLKAAERYAKAGFETAARSALESIQPGEPDHGRATVLLVRWMLKDGNLDQARERLLAMEKGDPGVPELDRWYWLGRLEQRAGRLPEAEGWLQRVVERQAEFRDSRRQLDRVRQRLKKEGSASRAKDAFGSPKESSGSIAQHDGRDPAASSGTLPAKVAGVTNEELAGLHFDVEERLAPWWRREERLLVRDQRSQKVVQLVTFPLSNLGDGTEDFRRQVQEVWSLRLAPVLELVEAIYTEDRVLLLYETFAGRSLAQILARRSLPLPVALSLLVQVCEGLAAAHKLGVVHRWLSPAALLLDESSRTKIAGFGLASAFAAGDKTSRAYVAPETRSSGSTTPASDIFSFGLLGTQLLGAYLPAGWEERDRLEPGEVDWPEELDPLAPDSVRTTLLRCLSKMPMDRPSAEQLRASLSAVGLVPGQVLADRYEILGELGRGGMSRVYRARDRDLDEEVAIKTVLAPALGHTEEEDRLLREVQICRKITHPNVVRVHDFGRFPNGIFVIMELLEGKGLDRVIRSDAPLELDQARDVLRQIVEALQEAHRLKIVHRDLKPANVIQDVDGRVKVMDFGIARMGDGPSHLTRTGQVVGSPMYMAPEQIQGRPLDGTCDLYALGVIGFALLTGREPFTGETTTAVVMKHLQEPPPDILALRPDLPQEWVDLILRLLAKSPSERYPSARELAQVLSQLPTEPVVAG